MNKDVLIHLREGALDIVVFTQLCKGVRECHFLFETVCVAVL